MKIPEIKIKDFLKKNYPSLNFFIAPSDTSAEEKLFKNSKYLNIAPASISYKRYGYDTLSYFAKKFVYDWFSDYNYKQIFGNIQAKLTNSGMSSIDLILNSLTHERKKRIIYPKNLYFAAQDLIKFYDKKIFEEVIEVNFSDPTFFNTLEKENTILYVEAISNHQNMSYLDEDFIVSLSKKVEYLVIDGTILGASRISPKIFENGNVIYIESLSKNYHFESSSLITAGISIYPDHLEDIFQRRFYGSGSYLQINSLIELPYESYLLGKERISSIVNNVQEIYEELKYLCKNSNVHLSEISDLNKMPSVLFLDFDTRERLSYFLEESSLSERQSFGHDSTHILPIGLLWDSAPPGLARITFGKEKDCSGIFNALKKLKLRDKKL